VIRDFQRTVSDSVDAILDAEIDNPPTASVSSHVQIETWDVDFQRLDSIIKSGAFLGVN
jgi:hypothetical protein